MFVSNDSTGWETAALTLNCVGIMLVIMNPESPKWLNEKGYYEKARQELVSIAKMNGVSEGILVENKLLREASADLD